MNPRCEGEAGVRSGGGDRGAGTSLHKIARDVENKADGVLHLALRSSYWEGAG